MPARRKPKKHYRADAFRAQDEERKQGRRAMCTALKFWTACGHKKCLRAQACVVNVDDCFNRLWPIVPEWLKVCFRASRKAYQAGLPPHEVKAAMERELVRWEEEKAREQARQAAVQAAAGSAPQSPWTAPNPPAPKPQAPNPPAPSPRLRVL